VVNDFVKAFLTPLVGLATGNAGDSSARTLRIAGSLFPYGAFINGLIAFVLTASALYYFVVLPTNRLMTRFHGERDAPARKRRSA
jgi:large conductance mechanosensitive channel